MNYDLQKVTAEVLQLWKKKTLPATIGHYLRDTYNLKVNKLCKFFNISQSLEVEKERAKLDALREHFKKNHKDFVAKRKIRQKQSKLHKLRKWYQR